MSQPDVQRAPTLSLGASILTPMATSTSPTRKMSKTKREVRLWKAKQLRARAATLVGQAVLIEAELAADCDHPESERDVWSYTSSNGYGRHTNHLLPYCRLCQKMYQYGSWVPRASRNWSNDD